MTLTQVRTWLEHYPVNHLSPVIFDGGNASKKGIHINIAEEPTTVGGLLDSLKWCAAYADMPVLVSGHPVHVILLRAWLGPVPVVLPPGCVQHGDRRQWVHKHPSGLRVVLTPVDGCTEIELSADFTRRVDTIEIPDASLDWLRAGRLT